jgi:hypothetical protein
MVLARRILLFLLPVLVLLSSCTRPKEAASSASESSSPIGVPVAAASTHSETATPDSDISEAAPAGAQTRIEMHNVILNERPGFQLRVRWLRGTMRPTRPGVIPSFDEPNSFVVYVDAGVVATSLTEISSLLNGGLLQGSPLEKVSLSADGQQLKLNGTLHKGIPLPIEMISNVDASPDGRIRLHVVKLRVLKMPVKSLLQSFRIKVGDLVSPKGATGIQVLGDDIYLNAEQVLPAPAIRGRLTDAHIGSKSGDLITIFGSAREEVAKTQEWRNFIRLRGGTINLGKLTMKHADLALIDTSDDDWFNFDLTRYEEQLVNGHIQMTPQAGLRIYMPDIDKIPRTAQNRAISPEWMKNRNVPPPAALTQ